MRVAPDDPPAIRRPWDLVAGGLAVGWIVALVWWMRAHFLDDAFIHLRYAEQLIAHGFLTYDGVTPSQGTSSPLYVVVLALASALGRWPFWLKVLGVAGYATLLGAILAGRRRAPLWVTALVVVLAGPMAVRTLTDGMETGWAGAFAAVLAGTAVGEPRRPGTGFVSWLPGVALGALMASLRVDMLVLLGAVAGADWIRRGRPSRAFAPALGGALALLATLALGLHLLPDGAVAKRAPWPIGLFLLGGVALSHVAAASFGLGLVALWAASWRRVHRRAAASDVRLQRAAALVNLVGPLFWGAVVLTGQLTHGVRYFVPFYIFAITWNIRAAPAAAPSSCVAGARLASAVFALAAVWVVELVLLAPIVRSRSETLRALRDGGLGRFSGQPAIAYDVGQIGYFSGADICDLHGLVNGRAAALAEPAARERACWTRRPAFVFLSPLDVLGLDAIATWPVCGRFDFRTVNHAGLHWLRVRPDLAAGMGAACEPADRALAGAAGR